MEKAMKKEKGMKNVEERANHDKEEVKPNHEQEFKLEP